MKKSLLVLGILTMLCVGLAYTMQSGRSDKPRLTFVVPADYCGEFALYVAYDDNATSGTSPWERAVAPQTDAQTMLARVPFEDDGIHLNLIAALDAQTPRIDRQSVSSWTHGSVHSFLIGHPDCEQPEVLDMGLTIEKQRAYSAQIEQ